MKYKNFSKMSERELLNFCKDLYLKNGIRILTYSNLEKIKGLYSSLYRKGLTQNKIIQSLDLKEEFTDFKREHFHRKVGDKIQRGWTWKRVLAETEPIVESHGFLPPAAWFQENGYQALVQGVYNLGRTWEDLRKVFNSFENSSFVESRNGLRWRSHPEASLSNFLYSRGIKHKKGSRYPDSFSEYSESNYGYYDLHFLSLQKKWIDVEIWGEKPKGNKDVYSRRRKYKEHFNIDNPNFLGIEFRDCYNEEILTKILKPYIGNIRPYIFDKPTDKIIQTTHWSNADELIEYCREFAKRQPNGVFPTEEWLRKRGKWSKRKGVAYNTLSIYIKNWIGGIRKLREILDQEEHSTIKWSKKSAVEALREWYEDYGKSPQAIRMDVRRGKLEVNVRELKKGANIVAAIYKYVGNMETACNEIGIKPSRKTPRKF